MKRLRLSDAVKSEVKRCRKCEDVHSSVHLCEEAFSDVKRCIGEENFWRARAGGSFDKVRGACCVLAGSAGGKRFAGVDFVARKRCEVAERRQRVAEAAEGQQQSP